MLDDLLRHCPPAPACVLVPLITLEPSPFSTSPLCSQNPLSVDPEDSEISRTEISENELVGPCCSSSSSFSAVLIQGNHVANSATVAIQTRGDGASETAQNTALQPHLVTLGQHTNTTSEPESKLEPSVSQSPPTEKAVEGENLVFLCQFTQSGHFDSSNLSVTWYNKKSEETLTVLVGNETKEEGYSGRVFLNGDWLGTGVASMTLLNVTSSDYGIYICSVTLPDGSTLEGDGTKLSVRKRSGLFGMEESIGTIIGVVAAAVGVTVGLVAIIVPQFRKKLVCFKK